LPRVRGAGLVPERERPNPTEPSEREPSNSSLLARRVWAPHPPSWEAAESDSLLVVVVGRKELRLWCRRTGAVCESSPAFQGSTEEPACW
jgi:hypothetical protein